MQKKKKKRERLYRDKGYSLHPTPEVLFGLRGSYKKFKSLAYFKLLGEFPLKCGCSASPEKPGALAALGPRAALRWVMAAP